MPKYGVDGDVLQINLNNVRVQNWDKTIVTIPTHTLMSDSFKNYRGMQMSGGRRIKRSINIKRSEEHTSELQSRPHLVCRLLLEKKKKNKKIRKHKANHDEQVS